MSFRFLLRFGPLLQSHLTGIEIGSAQAHDFLNGDLQSHLTGIEMEVQEAITAFSENLQSHLTGIEIQILH